MVYKIKYNEISTKYECVKKWLMILGYNIWMICLRFESYVASFEFVWMQFSSVYVVFNNFVLIDV